MKTERMRLDELMLAARGLEIVGVTEDGDVVLEGKSMGRFFDKLEALEGVISRV